LQSTLLLTVCHAVEHAVINCDEVRALRHGSYRYIRAAACPKDVVILLDVSGSMKGLRIEIARATVEKILDTLTDDDFFNVIMVRITYRSLLESVLFWF